MLKKNSIELLQKHQTYEERVNKAHSDLKMKINSHTNLMQQKNLAS